MSQKYILKKCNIIVILFLNLVDQALSGLKTDQLLARVDKELRSFFNG